MQKIDKEAMQRLVCIASLIGIVIGYILHDLLDLAVQNLAQSIENQGLDDHVLAQSVQLRLVYTEVLDQSVLTDSTLFQSRPEAVVFDHAILPFLLLF